MEITNYSMHEDLMGDPHEKRCAEIFEYDIDISVFVIVLQLEELIVNPLFYCLSLSKGVTFSHQVHGSGSSLAYLQYRRGTPPRWRRYWNCAICAHNTAFVGRPLLNGESVLLRKITNKSLGFLAACKLLTITCTEI
ncbi:hypothetical protein CDAR_476701 [Caerostris darwini]|uniref:Uncharacterized protein n=1 Tax=Caerostris darwini TaxID=1538125 RepID=A0AAV4TY92_9ARAC|nr:hypothetical protein CDAR_476701 [Caerostris darwini]